MDIAEIEWPIERLTSVQIEAACNIAKSGPKVFIGEFSKDAAEADIRAQGEHFITLYKYANSWRSTFNISQDIDNILRNFWGNYVTQAVNQADKVVEQREGGHAVRSNSKVKLLNPDLVAHFMITTGAPDGRKYTSDYALEVIALTVAIVLECINVSATVSAANSLGGLALHVQKATTKMLFLNLVRDEPERLLPEINNAKAILGNIRALLDHQKKEVAKITAELDALTLRNEAAMKYGDVFETKLNGLKDDSDALMKSLEERLKLNQARKLWGDTGNGAAIAFGISAVIIIVALAAVPFGAFVFRLDILEFLRNMEAAMLDGASGDNGVAQTISAVSRVLVITAPLGFIIWLLRIVVRFNTRSLLLMDDARQRVTMLNTYLFLIEQDAAVKQDRGAILEALFRRAPGHGTDTVDPPHFTDLLRYGQETSPKIA